jgi:hypothetical protein
LGKAQVSAELVIPVQKTRDTEETLGEPEEEILHPSRRVAVLVGAVMVLVVAVATVLIVVRINKSSADESAAGPAVNVVASPTAGSTPQPSGSAGPGAVVVAPASAPASVTPSAPVTDILLQGSVRMSEVAGQAQEAFDFDLAAKGDPVQNSDWEPDVLAANTGLTGMNGASFAHWTPTAKPTHAGCSTLLAAQWDAAIPLPTLLPGSMWCVRTSSGRVAAFTVSTGATVVNGALYSRYLNFVTWKKPGE